MPDSFPPIQTAPKSPPGRRRRWLRPLLALGAAVVALALAEFAARWQVEGSFGEAVESVLGTRAVDDPAAAHGEKGVVFDADLGFRLSPGTPGLGAHGLRHGPLPSPKPAAEYRVFLLGDSVGFALDGFFADAGADLGAHTRRALTFVNACVHGYTTYQERRFLERDLLGLQPDLVVLQYCVNDNYRFLHRLTSSGRRLLTVEARNHLFPDGDGAWPWLSRSSYLVYLLRKAWLGRAEAELRAWQGTARTAWNAASWPEQDEHVTAIATALRARGARLAVVAVPHEDQLDPAALAADAVFVCTPQRQLAAICARLDVPFLDLHAVMAARRLEGLFTDRTHLSGAGHRLVGRELAAFLRARALVPLD